MELFDGKFGIMFVNNQKRNLVKKYMFGLLFFIAIHPAITFADWVYIGRSMDGEIDFSFENTPTYMRGDIVVVRFARNFLRQERQEKQQDGSNDFWKQELDTLRIDCKKMLMQPISTERFMDGKKVSARIWEYEFSRDNLPLLTLPVSYPFSAAVDNQCKNAVRR